jgi:hypothetical protein
MMNKITAAIVSILFFVITASFGVAGDKPALDSLIVYGEGFAFGVKEPPGWVGDCQNSHRFGANIIFYRKSETAENAKALIRILVADKTDENTKADLEYDMENYKAKYRNVKFKDIHASHPKYKTFPKLFFVPDTFFEYVVYINPGEGIPQLYSVSMNKQKKEATNEELEVFKSIIRSIVMISKDLKILNTK